MTRVKNNSVPAVTLHWGLGYKPLTAVVIYSLDVAMNECDLYLRMFSFTDRSESTSKLKYGFSNVAQFIVLIR